MHRPQIMSGTKPLEVTLGTSYVPQFKPVISVTCWADIHFHILQEISQRIQKDSVITGSY